MSKTKKEIAKRKEREEERIVEIRDFLRANAGLSYTAEDIAEEMDIACVGDILHSGYDSFVRAVGIKATRVVNEENNYCGTVIYYSCNEKLLKRLWKRKGAKEEKC